MVLKIFSHFGLGIPYKKVGETLALAECPKADGRRSPKADVVKLYDLGIIPMPL